MDAANAFNRLNREQALAEVRKSWPRAARFIFNAYKGYKMIFVDGTDEILYSEDGCTPQGDPIAMLLLYYYGVGVKPLFVVVKEKKVAEEVFSDNKGKKPGAAVFCR